MKKYILSIDQGTTSSRAIIFNKEAQIVSTAQKEFKQIFPNDGWVEHDPMEIWATQWGMIQEAISKANIKSTEIAAFAITNQRETTILWDKTTGKPVYNAIVWQDRRTAAICEQIREEGKADLIRQKTGLVVDSYFSGTKIKWILDNVPEAKKLAEENNLLFGTVDTWLIWNLTEGKIHATDYSNASRTMIYNIIDHKWDEEILELLGIPSSILPEVKQSSEIYGYVSENLTHTKIPIAGVAGDQQAATFGQFCLKEGMAKNTYGTGCFTLLNIGKKANIKDDNLITTIAWGRKDSITYALEGSVFIGGAIVQWLRDGLELFQKSSEVEKLALSVKDNGGVYMVPAFVGLGAPYWDPYARGSIFGITRGTTKAHIARAALESIAFQSMDVLDAMEQSSNIKLQELRVDGGASKNDMLMQFQADILNTKVVRPTIVETTALGAAYLAGLATEFWDSAEGISALWQVDKVFEPSMSQEKREEVVAIWHKAVKQSMSWLK